VKISGPQTSCLNVQKNTNIQDKIRHLALQYLASKKRAKFNRQGTEEIEVPMTSIDDLMEYFVSREKFSVERETSFISVGVKFKISPIIKFLRRKSCMRSHLILLHYGDLCCTYTDGQLREGNHLCQGKSKNRSK